MSVRRVMPGRIDDSGKLAIPQSILDLFGWSKGNTLEIELIEGERGFTVQALFPSCSLCREYLHEHELTDFKSGRICHRCFAELAKLKQ